jgi:hypothetical protein
MLYSLIQLACLGGQCTPYDNKINPNWSLAVVFFQLCRMSNLAQHQILFCSNERASLRLATGYMPTPLHASRGPLMSSLAKFHIGLPFHGQRGTAHWHCTPGQGLQ